MKCPYNGNEPFMPLGSWRSIGKDVKIYTFVCVCVCVCVCVFSLVGKKGGRNNE